jgi:hypothetical protein
MSVVNVRRRVRGGGLDAGSGRIFIVVFVVVLAKRPRSRASGRLLRRDLAESGERVAPSNAAARRTFKSRPTVRSIRQT